MALPNASKNVGKDVRNVGGDVSRDAGKGEKTSDTGLDTVLNAGLYVRVSTMNQVDRESLSTQESRLRAYCEANGYRVYEVYRDAGFSGKDTKRPGLQALMSDVEAGRVQVVLVTKLDRITRSLRDLLKLVEFFHKHDVKFISITQNIDSSGPFGRFMRDLLGLIAQLEREVTAERVAEDMYHRAGLGKWNGGVVPYGYTTRHRIMTELLEQGYAEDEALRRAMELAPEPKRLYPDPEEAEVVRRIFRIFLETRSIRKTTHTVNALGFRTRRGVPWAASSIHRILTNPTYIGRIWYGKRKTNPVTGRLKQVPKEQWRIEKGEHEAIVSEEVFYEAQRVLASREKPSRAKRTYLLSGLIRCGRCGGPMYGYTHVKNTGKASKGKAYSYYKCHNHATKGKSVCPGLSVPTKLVEDAVIEKLLGLSKDQAFLRDREKILAMLEQEVPDDREQEMQNLRRREKDLQSRLDVLMDKLESGLIEDLDFKARYDRIKQDLQQVRLAQESLAMRSDLERVSYEALKASLDELMNFGKNWEFLDHEGKRMRLHSVVKEVRVFPEGRVEVDVFLDVNEVFRRDMGSWPLRA